MTELRSTPLYLPSGNDDYVFVSKKLVKSLEDRVAELEGEMEETARACAQPILNSVKFNAQIDFDVYRMDHIIDLELEPIRYRTRITSHPLDYAGANLRDAIICQLQKRIAPQFAALLFKQWEKTQRYA